MSLWAEIRSLGSNTKGIFFIVFFRASSFFTGNRFLKIIGLPIRMLYKFIVQWMLGIDIPDSTQIKRGFTLYHGQGLVVHEHTQIAENVTLRHNTTIGISRDGGGAPVIEQNVVVGANSVIIGNIVIGKDAVIGAGSVVLKDVPAGAVVAGNPARIIRMLSVEQEMEPA